MFTVFALIASVISFICMMHGPKLVTTRINVVGFYFAIIAGILWAVVAIALIHWTIGWLWVHAP